MATFALKQIDVARALFSALNQHNASSRRYRRNFQWLQKLHARASAKIFTASSTPKPGPQGGAESDRQVHSEDREDTEDVELLGWQTKLIERAEQGRPVISTICPPPTPATSQVTDFCNLPTNPRALGDDRYLQTSPDAEILESLPLRRAGDPTDDVLRDFWEPMLLQDIFGAPDDQLMASASVEVRWRVANELFRCMGSTGRPGGKILSPPRIRLNHNHNHNHDIDQHVEPDKSSFAVTLAKLIVTG
ncbi:hypothetical protein H2204_015119 [Knufia peltigerae]|uniref:Uncharacterized protein n=1 Tax=Knufia peltigerae TaxID=1002370 RepID=A0AA38XEH7_9EURO|nr:hypothetical protein H2204_015119 [Knufia peltigerae]